MRSIWEMAATDIASMSRALTVPDKGTALKYVEGEPLITFSMSVMTETM